MSIVPARGGNHRWIALALGGALALGALALRPRVPPPVPASATPRTEQEPAPPAPPAGPDLTDLEGALAAAVDREQATWRTLHHTQKIPTNLPLVQDGLDAFARLERQIDARLGGAPTTPRGHALRARAAAYRFLTWSELARMRFVQENGAIGLLDAHIEVYDEPGLPLLAAATAALGGSLAAALPEGDTEWTARALEDEIVLSRCFGAWLPKADWERRYVEQIARHLAHLRQTLGAGGSATTRFLAETWSTRLDRLPGERGRALPALRAAFEAALPKAGARVARFSMITEPKR